MIRYVVVVNTPLAPGDRWFFALLGLPALGYAGFILSLLAADAAFVAPADLIDSAASPEVRDAVVLTFASATAAAFLSLLVGVPAGYLLARVEFHGKGALDALLEVPLVLPPLVVGLSLLLLVRTPPGRLVEQFVPLLFEPAGVVLAQWAVAAAFAVRTMRVAFDQLDPRGEQVALTLGCTRWGAFWRVAVPSAGRGVVAAATVAWARSVGEFGPVLVFCAAIPHKTLVMSTSVYLSISTGRVERAVAVSLAMAAAAVCVLVVARRLGVKASA